MCCCDVGAHFLSVETRRGLFNVAPHAEDIVTSAEPYMASFAKPDPKVPLSVTLSSALQARLADIELLVAVGEREQTAGHWTDVDDLLVVDGPLRGRSRLPRALGYIKSHRAAYLPADQHAMIGLLQAGQRTLVFRMGTSWDRHSWYLRAVPARRPLVRHRPGRMLPRPVGQRCRRPSQPQPGDPRPICRHRVQGRGGSRKICIQ